jgi:hypothetical protein
MIRIPEYHIFGDIWERHLKPRSVRYSDGIFPMNAGRGAHEAKLDAIIYLPEWPVSSRRTDSRPKPREIDILVHARERFTLSTPHRILESKIKVTYWRVDASRKIAEPLSTVHYDYDYEPRPGHPVYHSQCSNDPVSDGPFSLSWQYAPEPRIQISCFPFRVPTPHMCLCSVLIGLVADHLPSEQFKSLWETIKSKGWAPPLAKHCELWSLGCANTDARILHNWQWYFWPESTS